MRKHRPDVIWVLAAIAIALTLGSQLAEPQRPALAPQQAGIIVQ